MLKIQEGGYAPENPPEETAKNQYEWTEEEKERIRTAANVIKRFENTYAVGEEAQKAECDAEQTILAYGHRVLPFLREQLSGSEMQNSKYARFLDALSQEEDFDLILTGLKKAGTMTLNEVNLLLRSLVRILRDIRQRDSHDLRLEKAGQELLVMLDTVELSWVKNSAIMALCTTGVREALAYINEKRAELEQGHSRGVGYDNRRNDYDDFKETFTDPEAEMMYIGREEFYTWKEQQQMREETRESNYEEYTADSEVEEIFPGLSSEIEQLEEQSGLNFEKEIEANKIVDRLFKNYPDLEKTAVPAIRLHMFNYVLANLDTNQEDINQEWEHIERLSKIEKEAQEEINPLPTIGVEVEIPNSKTVHSRTSKILTFLNIPHGYESLPSERGEKLLEVNPNFSYNALTQARIIQELTRLGAIRRVQYEGEKHLRVPIPDILSMHINFGLPAEIKGNVAFYQGDLYRVNDVLTAAFASSDRIYNRKTSTSLTWYKSAVKTKKHKKVESAVEESAKKNDEGPERYFRLEMRAVEFKDYPSYRLLVEAQRLMAMLIAHIKEQENIPCSKQEKLLAGLWYEFVKETMHYFNKLNFTHKPEEHFVQNMADKNSEGLQELMKTTDLKERCRTFANKYSRLVAGILQSEKD